jgi:large subunit ribosomal protein L23
MRDPYDIVHSARITEKGAALSEHNRYVFRVRPDATKQEIKFAIERIFKKNVIGVNTLNVTGKLKRRGRGRIGRSPSWKKAIVTLKEGEKIDLV